MDASASDKPWWYMCIEKQMWQDIEIVREYVFQDH